MPETTHQHLSAALVWCRRDLRAHDHAALHHALRAARRVWVAFVFDREILDPLPRADRRVEFIRESLVELDATLRAMGLAQGVAGVGLIVRHGRAREEIPRLAAALRVQAVYANDDYEPAARARASRFALVSIPYAAMPRRRHQPRKGPLPKPISSTRSDCEARFDLCGSTKRRHSRSK